MNSNSRLKINHPLRIPIWLFIILAYISQSCVTYENIKIQVLKPAEIAIPSSVNSIILVNHSNIPKSSFSNSDGAKVAVINTIDDSLRSTQYILGLQQVLNNSPRFKVINEKPIYLHKPSFSKRYKALDWPEIEKFCAENKSDAALVLENFQIYNSDPLNIKYRGDFGYYGYLEVQNNSLWKLYIPQNKQVVDDYLLKDTLVWDTYGSYSFEIANRLPDTNDALLQSCFYAGTRYGERIAQTWTSKNRYLVSCEKTDFKNAIQLAKAGKWEEAIALWKKYPYGDNNRLASLASYNMAIASETLDNIDAALEWAAKSYLLRENEFVQNYINILEIRKQEKLKIENQLK